MTLPLWGCAYSSQGAFGSLQGFKKRPFYNLSRGLSRYSRQRLSICRNTIGFY